MNLERAQVQRLRLSIAAHICIEVTDPAERYRDVNMIRPVRFLHDSERLLIVNRRFRESPLLTGNISELPVRCGRVCVVGTHGMVVEGELTAPCFLSFV